MRWDFWRRKKEAKPVPASTGRQRAMAAMKAVSVQSFRRGFEAAKRSRIHAGWSGNRSANADLRPALRNLRALSRHLANNNDYGKRFLGLLKNNVIGPTGIRLQAMPLGDDGKVDRADAKYIEGAWRDFCKKGIPTVDGRLTMVDACKLFIETLARDGEVLIRHFDGWKGNEFRYAFGFIEADHLDEDLNRPAYKGRGKVRMGVELDIYSRARAFHLLTQHPGDDLPEVQGRRYEAFSPEEIEHCFIVERPGQVRGIPWMAVSGKGMHMLDGYEEAELVASRIAASKMGFFTSDDGEGYTGDETETEEDEEGLTREAPVMTAEPGTFEDISGYQFTPWDPQHPTGAFGEFVRAILRRIAGGLNMSYVALANDLKGVSWSSVRYAAIEDRDVFMMLQGFVIEHFLTPVFGHWLKNAIMAGRLKLPYRRLAKYQRVNWQPRRWKWVDPAKESAGNEKDLSMGINSPQRISADSHGDLEEIFQEIAEAVALAEEKGILHLFPYLQGSKTNAKASPNPDD